MKEEREYHIEGERICLRDVRPDDVNENYIRWMNDPEVTQYLEARFSPCAEDDIKRYVGSMAGKDDEIFLAICLRDGGAHIGNIKLGPINKHHSFAYISLVIGEKGCWGKGYATEAISLMVRFAFDELGLHKVMAGCYANNAGSAKAFEKAGFSREGIERKKWMCNGEYVDGVVLGLVNPAWSRGRNG
jgi:RimJ/RimL family protein N-acetyltransferase